MLSCLYFQLLASDCIVHLPLTTVGVCVDPVGVGQVCVDGNIHVFRLLTPPDILVHSIMNSVLCSGVASPGNIAVHVPPIGVAVKPPMVEGLHIVCGSPS